MKLLLFLAFAALTLVSPAQQILPQGHSHNDYTHEHPLFDALKYSFKSIEIDVWLYEGRLIVSHDNIGLASKKDIEELYFKPISERIKANGGWVYKGDTTPTIFMVEFKSDGEQAYQKLKELIVKYKEILCDRTGRGGAIKILITGNKPWTTLLKGNEMYATGDGSIGQSSQSTPNYIMERVSDPYSSHFEWRGKGVMPSGQKAKLQALVKTAHEHGRQIRFYACPNKENIWRALLDAHVDWINVDDLERFATFYTAYIQNTEQPKQ
jgi:glycerophosphoryl diester phosphodiesterase